MAMMQPPANQLGVGASGLAEGSEEIIFFALTVS